MDSRPICLFRHRDVFGHLHLPVDYLLVTPEAVYLFFRHVLFVDERYVAILLRPFHMAEIALVFGYAAVTLRDFGMALGAGVPCPDCLIVRETPALYHDILFWCRMAGRAAGCCLCMRGPFEMAEETYVHGYLEMLPLDNVGMAASAVELYAASHL